MIYCDTSLLVAVLTSEQMSEAAFAWLSAQNVGQLTVSWWVETEIASAIASKRRARLLDDGQRRLAERFWTDMRSSFGVAEVTAKHFSAAARLVEAGDGLKAPDALHLAIVEDHGWQIATLDRALARAALAIGVVVPSIVAD
jgi:predicted nucleic acid-binding protein